NSSRHTPPTPPPNPPTSHLLLAPLTRRPRRSPPHRDPRPRTGPSRRTAGRNARVSADLAVHREQRVAEQHLAALPDVGQGFRRHVHSPHRADRRIAVRLPPPRIPARHLPPGAHRIARG